MRRPKLTEEQKDRICDLRERRGWSYERIAREVGCSIGSVSWCCLQLGAEKPNAGPIKIVRTRPQSMQRGGHTVRLFTEEEDRRLLEMTTAGMKPTEIGRALGRRYNSIVGRRATLARRDERGTA